MAPRWWDSTPAPPPKSRRPRPSPPKSNTTGSSSAGVAGRAQTHTPQPKLSRPRPTGAPPGPPAPPRPPPTHATPPSPTIAAHGHEGPGSRPPRAPKIPKPVLLGPGGLLADLYAATGVDKAQERVQASAAKLVGGRRALYEAEDRGYTVHRSLGPGQPTRIVFNDPIRQAALETELARHKVLTPDGAGVGAADVARRIAGLSHAQLRKFIHWRPSALEQAGIGINPQSVSGLIHGIQNVGPAVAQATVGNNVAGHALGDLLSWPVAGVGAAYDFAQHPGQVAKGTLQQFEHPIASFKAHPLYTLALGRGLEAAVGRTIGGAARVTGINADTGYAVPGVIGKLQRGRRAIGNLERRPAESSDNVIRSRGYSKDPFVKAFQAAQDRYQENRYGLGRKVTVPGVGHGGGDRVTRAIRQPAGRIAGLHPAMAQREARALADAQAATAVTGTRSTRTRTGHVLHQQAPVRGERLKGTQRILRAQPLHSHVGAVTDTLSRGHMYRPERDIVSVVGQRIARTPETFWRDLAAKKAKTQALLDQDAAAVKARRQTGIVYETNSGEREQAQELVDTINRLERHKNQIDPKRVFASADKMAPFFNQLEAQSKHVGILSEGQIRAKYFPYTQEYIGAIYHTVAMHNQLEKGAFEVEKRQAAIVHQAITDYAKAKSAPNASSAEIANARQELADVQRRITELKAAATHATNLPALRARAAELEAGANGSRAAALVAQHGGVREALKATHPDLGGRPEDFRAVNAHRKTLEKVSAAKARVGQVEGAVAQTDRLRQREAALAERIRAAHAGVSTAALARLEREQARLDVLRQHRYDVSGRDAGMYAQHEAEQQAIEHARIESRAAEDELKAAKKARDTAQGMATEANRLRTVGRARATKAAPNRAAAVTAYIERHMQSGNEHLLSNEGRAEATTKKAEDRVKAAEARRKAARTQFKEAEQNARTPLPEANAGLRHDNGYLLSDKEIEAHMRANGVDPSKVFYVPHHVRLRDGRAYYQSANGRRRSLPGATRTGHANAIGALPHTWEHLVEHGVGRSVTLDTIHSHDRFLQQIGIRRPDGSMWTPNQAEQAVKDSGGKLMFVRAAPASHDAAAVEKLQNPMQHLNPEAGLVAHDWELRQHIRAGDENTPNGVLVPRAVFDRYLQHANAHGHATLHVIDSAFRRAVLPFSSKWLFGNTFEAAIRSALAGAANPVTNPRVASRIFRSMLAHDAELTFGDAGKQVAAEAEQARTPLAHVPFTQARARMKQAELRLEEHAPHAVALRDNLIGGLLYGRRDLSVHVRPGQTIAGPAGSAFTHAPVIHELHQALLGLTNGVFKGNRAIEQTFEKMVVGKHLRNVMREFGTSWQRTILVQQTAVEQAAKGLMNTPEQVRAAQYLHEVLGKYSGFSPATRQIVQSVAPFLPWYLNSVRFVFHTLPVRYPVATAVIAQAERQFQQDWDEQHKNVPAGDLKTAIPYHGGYVNLAHFTPFGFPGPVAAGDLSQIVSPLYPQGHDVINAFQGLDPFGRRLKDSQGNDVQGGKLLPYIINAALESGTPLAPIRRILEGGQTGLPNSSVIFGIHTKPGPRSLLQGLNHQFNPLRPTYIQGGTKRKRKGSGGFGGGAGFGGGSFGGGGGGFGGGSFGGP